ncbi:MAG: DEDD exonuclease domain-containing protein, partial [Nocardioidaceae bacterium]
RELRLIKQHKPRYNRRSRHPERVQWLKLTVEPWPRLSLVRQVLDDTATYLGPFSSRRAAERASAALHEAFRIRQCTGRMPIEPHRNACILGEMGRCLAPCDGSVTAGPYDAEVARLRRALLDDPSAVVEALRAKMSTLSTARRFEDASVHRDRLTAFLRAAARMQRLAALTRCSELVAARRNDTGAWEVHVVRHGRLAAAGVIPAGAHAGEWVRALRAGAESVVTGSGPTPAATAEESERILRWLESPGIRLVHLDGEWSCPIGGAEGRRHELDGIEASRSALVPFDDRRDLSLHHQPIR